MAMRRLAGLSTDVMWFLLKTLPGQRAGAAAWIKKATREALEMGLTRCDTLPYIFKSLKDGVVFELHMDDIHGTGSAAGSKAVIAELRRRFDLKASDVIETGRYAHLRRDRLKLIDETLVRPDQRHIDNMVELMGMEKAKPAGTPSLDGPEPADDPELDAEEHNINRRCVGIALHLSCDG